MVNSTRLRRSSKSSTWPGQSLKPYPDFPLTAHQSGRWCKKIRGKQIFFGKLDDWQAALDKYLQQKDALYAGRRPVEQDAVFTVEKLVNKFLAFKQSLVDTGELSQLTWNEYHASSQRMLDVFGWDRAIEDLRPDDFEKYRAKLGKTLGPVRLGNEVQRVRSVFKYAFDCGLIDRPVRFGPGFKKPSLKVIRLHRAAKGIRMFEAKEIHRMLEAASVQLRAMILLGANCGFGNHDCGNLPWSALDLTTGWVNYPRPKTGIQRRCPMWPETAQALEEVRAARPTPKKPEHAGLVFITQRGGSWAKDIADSPITKEIRKLLDTLGINGERNFYCLRHGFETIGGESRDQVAVDHIMGHVDPSMGAQYRERISDERLLAVTEYVRRWLFA